MSSMKGKANGKSKSTSFKPPENELKPSDEEEDELDNEGDGEESDNQDFPHQKTFGPKSKQKKTPMEVKKPRLVPYVQVPALPKTKPEPRDFIKLKSDMSKKERQYRRQAPIDDVDSEEEMKEIISKFDNVKMELTPRQLMRIAKPLRKEITRLLTPKRVPAHDVSLMAVPEDPPSLSEVESSGDEEDSIIRNLPDPEWQVLEEERDGLPKGAVIISDPVCQYLSTLAPGEAAKKVVVARESHNLRSLYPLINGTLREESLLDGGSQIVSMSLDAAKTLGLGWDPNIVIHMQSANKQVEPTLGLAKNVPFLFNDITIYLQVHVIRNPAYRVLLGRPFEVVTESTVKNMKDGSQLITLTDPNSGRQTTMASVERGQPPKLLQKQPARDDSFQASMNSTKER